MTRLHGFIESCHSQRWALIKSAVFIICNMFIIYAICCRKRNICYTELQNQNTSQKLSPKYAIFLIRYCNHQWMLSEHEMPPSLHSQILLTLKTRCCRYIILQVFAAARLYHTLDWSDNKDCWIKLKEMSLSAMFANAKIKNRPEWEVQYRLVEVERFDYK